MNPRPIKLLLGAMLLLAARPVLAEAEKLGFKGVELGSNLAQIASNPKFDCRVVSTPIADKVCGLRPREKETIAGAPVDSLFYFYDQTGLTGIVVNLDEKHFQPVVAALTEKFGSPGLKTETVKSLKGVAFENRTYRWTRPEGSLLAERYAGRLDKSTIRYTDDSAAQRVRQRRALLAKDPRKDL
ncbi:MAG: hypothetical protein B7Y41_07410 [Hydrogenophilales bacterium 28-61-23]|nr:MAG: hypothetical protein B7Y41_07410 [Hydrogenophilales bacterium 28-61-23]